MVHEFTLDKVCVTIQTNFNAAFGLAIAAHRVAALMVIFVQLCKRYLPQSEDQAVSSVLPTVVAPRGAWGAFAPSSWTLFLHLHKLPKTQSFWANFWISSPGKLRNAFYPLDARPHEKILVPPLLTNQSIILPICSKRQTADS